MKQFFAFTILFLSFGFTLQAQNFIDIAGTEFTTPESYGQEEPNVLLCANYMYDNPASDADLNRLLATQFIIKWMTGTPDYTFDIGEQVMELTKGNEDLLGMYLAGASKVVLEHKDIVLTADDIYAKVEALLVDYCANEDNNMKPSRKIKRIIKNRKQ